MYKLLKQNQNLGKALELRMEEGAFQDYRVILSGITIHHARNCANGTCEGNFMFTDNLTYRVNSFTSLNEAKTEYEAIKRQYID